MTWKDSSDWSILRYDADTINNLLLLLSLLPVYFIVLTDEVCKCFVDVDVDDDVSGKAEKEASVPHHLVRYSNTSISWCN